MENKPDQEGNQFSVVQLMLALIGSQLCGPPVPPGCNLSSADPRWRTSRRCWAPWWAVDLQEPCWPDQWSSPSTTVLIMSRKTGSFSWRSNWPWESGRWVFNTRSAFKWATGNRQLLNSTGLTCRENSCHFVFQKIKIKEMYSDADNPMHLINAFQ